MDNKTLRIMADNQTIRTAIEAGMKAGKPVVLTFATWKVLLDLMDGDANEVILWMVTLVEKYECPIMTNLPAPNGESQTAMIFPQSWGEEKRKGWASGMAVLLSDDFGKTYQITDMTGRAI